ncbi:MAG: GDP-mannose 4,6-dehydratase, partial [Methylococcales bacterium]
VVVVVDPVYFRPTEVDLLVGNASKARNKLGWVPEYDLGALVDDMMSSDLNLVTKEQYIQAGGYRIMKYYE